MTIFGRVLCPCSHLACLHCMLPGHCCSAPSLSCRLSPFLLCSPPPPPEHFSSPSWFLFLLTLPLITRFPSSPPLLSCSSCYFTVLSFLPQTHFFFRSSSLHPFFTASFVLSLLITSRAPPLLPYPSPAGSCAHPGLLHWRRAGSRGLLAPGLFWLHPCVPNQPCCTVHTCLQNSLTYAHPHACAPTLLFCVSLRGC